MKTENRFYRTGQRFVLRRAVLVVALVTMFATPAAGQGDGDVYVVGEQDVISISVWGQEALSVTAGRSPEQIRRTIEEILPQYFTTRQTVSVIVTEINSKKIYLLGEVQTPGVYDLRSSLSMLQTLAMAGGLTEFADRNGITVIRKRADGGEERIPFDYKKAVAGKGGGDLMLESGDIVVVP